MEGDLPPRRRWRWLLVFAVVTVAVLGFRWATADPRWAVARMLGEPVPASVRNVRFHTDELGGLTPEPTYELRFEASAGEVAALLKREGFLLDPRPNPTWGKRRWMRSQGSPNDLVMYVRDRKPPGCIVEFLWWDAVRGEVFYIRSCP